MGESRVGAGAATASQPAAAHGLIARSSAWSAAGDRFKSLFNLVGFWKAM